MNGESRPVEMVINGLTFQARVEPRLLLCDFLRYEVGLTGTHVGCEQGVCGACTVQVEGKPIRSCLMFAVQVNGLAVRTVEGLAVGTEMHKLQRAFHEAHALQCGFCTPGILMTLDYLLREKRLTDLDEEGVRRALSGNLCRCTGYENIVRAVQAIVPSLGG